tara:strand:- start:1239 stop:1415 length:177 start_codon:yes stop_codon:yes gene_type:complete
MKSKNNKLFKPPVKYMPSNAQGMMLPGQLAAGLDAQMNQAPSQKFMMPPAQMGKKRQN